MLIAQRYKKAEGKNYEYISVALQPLGLIRDSFQMGKITVADIFQVLSLGLGPDGAAGYPLVAFYVRGREMKDILEVHASMAPFGEIGCATVQVFRRKIYLQPLQDHAGSRYISFIQDEKGDYQQLDYKNFTESARIFMPSK